MTRLRIGTPLFKELTRGNKPTYIHRILLYMLLRELMEKQNTFTIDISENLIIKYNTANTVLHRMKHYEYVSGKKTTVTRYKANLLLSDKIEEITIFGDELPEHIEESDIIEKDRKKLVNWKLTTAGRRYAKFIWFNPGRYNLEDTKDRYQKLGAAYGTKVVDLSIEESDFMKNDQKDISESFSVKDEVSIKDLQKKVPVPVDTIPIIVQDYFEDNGYVWIMDSIDEGGPGYLVGKPTGEINQIKIRLIPSMDNGFVISGDDQKFLRENDSNQICVVSSLKDPNPKVLNVISFERTEDESKYVPYDFNDRMRELESKLKNRKRRK